MIVDSLSFNQRGWVTMKREGRIYEFPSSMIQFVETVETESPVPPKT